MLKPPPPKKKGTVNGKYVSIQPSRVNMMKCGMISTKYGTINVASTTPNQKSRPLN